MINYPTLLKRLIFTSNAVISEHASVAFVNGEATSLLSSCKIFRLTVRSLVWHRRILSAAILEMHLLLHNFMCFLKMQACPVLTRHGIVCSTRWCYIDSIVYVGCWHGCLSGARCRFTYGPADTTATHCLLLQEIQIGFGFTFLVPAHPGNPWQNPEGCKTVIVVVVVDRE